MIGVDTSADMLRQARERLPAQTFIEANIAHWAPPAGTDVLFANAVFQWVPDHLKQLKRLVGALAAGRRARGADAGQSRRALAHPDARGGVSGAVAQAARRRRPSCATRCRSRVPITTRCSRCVRASRSGTRVYNHVLDDAAAIVEWVKGTGLRPFVDPLEPPERKAYLAEYTARIAASYLPQADGKVLLRFPRIFIVAVK